MKKENTEARIPGSMVRIFRPGGVLAEPQAGGARPKGGGRRSRAGRQARAEQREQAATIRAVMCLAIVALIAIRMLVKNYGAHPRELLFPAASLAAAVAFGAFLLRPTAPPPTRTDEVADGELTTLPVERLAEAAAVTAAAFEASPVYVALAGRDALPNDRRRLLRFIFERNLWLRMPSGCNRVVIHDGRVVCSFMLVTPAVPKVRTVDMVRAGLLKLPFLFGLGVLRRLFTLISRGEAIETAIKAELGHPPMCLLERMVVAPEMQGQRIGSRALAQALGETDAAGCHVLLATNEERNVTFYSRLGFRVVRRVDEEVEGFQYTAWYMVRPPTTRVSPPTS